jgi:hypothetical protein
MADQGWMVDDGTCDPCLDRHCWRCPDTHEEAGGDGDVLTICCCDEQYIVSRQAPGGTDG